MGKQKLKGKELRKLGYRSDQSKSLAINIMATHYKHFTKHKKLELLAKILETPEEYAEHKWLRPIAECFLTKVIHKEFTSYKLEDKPKPYTVFGRKFICQNTINQMDMVMRSPAAVEGALMPDAHVGYGIPIGGVVATRNEIIPYGVGMDIGCRMSLTILDADDRYLQKHQYKFKMAVKENTHFGIVKDVPNRMDHEVLNRKEFAEHEVLKALHGKAYGQLGTSGGGNHFVEFGLVELDETNTLGVDPGKYVAILSHSGSRGMGAAIANYYTKVATDICKLPRGAQHMAWLDLNSAEGQAYWIAMNLAGDYAKACHDVIHKKLMKSVGLKPLKTIENHHNFAWKEKDSDGNQLIVHRKGATPAAVGQLGIVPGSMTTPGFIVRGKGESSSLNSASHGAGRAYSRSKAKSSFTMSEIRKELKKNGVTLYGGGVDEGPMAYKDIHQVINQQQELVDVEGVFYPKIVRMCKD